MTQHDDPPRLFESSGAPADLRMLLSDAYDDQLDRAACERVATSVVHRIAPGGGGHGRSGAPSGNLFSGSFAKVLTGLSVGLLGGALWVGLSANHSPPEPMIDAPSVVSATPTEPAPPASTTRTLIEVAAVPLVERGSPVAPDSAPTHTVRMRRTETTVALAPTTPSAPPPQPPSTVLEEHRLLRAARAALPDDPERTLSLTREHARRFPTGMLIQEREVLAVRALAALGKRDQARSRARDFEDRYPDSPHNENLDEAVDDQLDR